MTITGKERQEAQYGLLTSIAVEPGVSLSTVSKVGYPAAALQRQIAPGIAALLGLEEVRLPFGDHRLQPLASLAKGFVAQVMGGLGRHPPRPLREPASFSATLPDSRPARG